MSFRLDALEEALRSLGDVLHLRGTPYSLLVLGGGGLLLLRLIDRPTGDLDVIALAEGESYTKVDLLPPPLRQAAVEVARAFDLSEDWLNTGPASLMDLGLPPGWEERVESRRFGALEVRILSRVDQVCCKRYAAVDRGPDDKHFQDLLLLHPTEDDLRVAARWSMTHDPSEGFRHELTGCLNALGVELDDDDHA